MNWIVWFQDPIRNFDGNHWFHIGEYYLSRARFATEMIAKHTNLTSSTDHTLYLFTSNIPFFQNITPFTFFLLVLTFWNPSVQIIRLGYLPQLLIPKIGNSLQIATATISYEFSLPYFLTHPHSPFHQYNLPNSTYFFHSPISGIYLGSLPNTPIHTSKWFPSIEDSQLVLKKAQYLCHSYREKEKETLPQTTPRRLQILIYQRNFIRKILNLSTFLSTLFTTDPILTRNYNLKIQYHDDNNQEICQLYSQFQQTNILITTHGFQLTGIVII
jgi:hypothetical protein